MPRGLFDRFTGFEPNRFEFPDLKLEQKQRAGSVLAWSRAGLPERSFAYMGASQHTLDQYIRHGKLKDFFPDINIRIADETGGHERAGIIRVENAEYTPKGSKIFIVKNDAGMLARAHFILSSLGMPINTANVRLACDLPQRENDLVIQAEIETFVRIVAQRRQISEEEARKNILDLNNKNKEQKGFILSLNSEIDNPSLLHKARGVSEDAITVPPDFHKYVIGLQPIGEVERSYLQGLKRAVSS